MLGCVSPLNCRCTMHRSLCLVLRSPRSRRSPCAFPLKEYYCVFKPGPDSTPRTLPSFCSPIWKFIQRLHIPLASTRIFMFSHMQSPLHYFGTLQPHLGKNFIHRHEHFQVSRRTFSRTIPPNSPLSETLAGKHVPFRVAAV